MDEEKKTNDNEDSKVYEIDINKKYILAFDNFIPDDLFERIKQQISDWIADKNRPILLLRGAGNGVRLVEIEGKKDDD